MKKGGLPGLPPPLLARSQVPRRAGAPAWAAAAAAWENKGEMNNTAGSDPCKAGFTRASEPAPRSTACPRKHC